MSIRCSRRAASVLPAFLAATWTAAAWTAAAWLAAAFLAATWPAVVLLALPAPAAAATPQHGDAPHAAHRPGAADPPHAAPRHAASGAGPLLSLLDQTPWIEPDASGSPAQFTLVLATGSGAPAGAQVVVSLYDALPTRSNFDETLTGPPSGLLDHTNPEPVAGLPKAGGGGIDLQIAIEPTTTAAPAPTPAPGAPTLDLHCQSDNGTCPGVYPLVVAMERTTGTVAAQFTTYLTYAGGSSPLRFAWVVPVSAPVVVRHGTHAPRSALAPLPAAARASLDGLVASLKRYTGVPVTVAAAPQTLEAMRAAGRAGGQAVTTLAAMSADQTVHQFLAEPYVPIDLGALAGAGEPTEISAQMGEGAAVLSKLGVQAPPGGSAWVDSGQVGTALGTGLAQVGATRVVVPDTSLSPGTSAGESGTFASTFTLSLGKGAALTAAASDGGLAAHFTAEPQDPALAANQLLADLAMIHFEAPNSATVRGVVAVPPAGWTPDARFDGVLLAGLQGNPDVQATTLSGFFSGFPAAATLPDRRPLTRGTGPVLSRQLAGSVTAARLHLTAFGHAVVGDPPVLSQLDQLLLASESDGLGSSGQAAGVSAFDRSLGGQLAQFSFATERTITLTARTGSVPVTVVSGASYTLVGTLTLSSERFEFPHGVSQKMVVDHPTNPVRVQVEARTSGDLPLEVSLDSPTGRLQIAHGELTVRATATSVVGIVLTVLALAVLLFWWARTWWAGRRRRRARQAAGAHDQ